LAAVTADALYPRFSEAALTEALADAPVVLIHGPVKAHFRSARILKNLLDSESFAGRVWGGM
jgi:hypothetical protein